MKRSFAATIILLLLMPGILLVMYPRSTVNTSAYAAPPLPTSPRPFIVEYIEEQLVIAPWGNGPGEIGYLPAQPERVAAGPLSMVVDSIGRIYILDSVNSRVLRFTTGGIYESAFDIDDSLGAIDLAVASNGDVYLLDGTNERVVRYSREGALLDQLTTARIILQANQLMIRSDGLVMLDGFQVTGDTSRPFEVMSAGIARTGLPLTHAEPSPRVARGLSTKTGVCSVHLTKIGEDLGNLILLCNEDEVFETQIRTAKPLVGVTLLDSDQEGNFYLRVDMFRVPLSYQVQIVSAVIKFSPKGDLLAVIPLPGDYYTQPYHSIEVDSFGRVYLLHPQKEKVMVTRFVEVERAPLSGSAVHMLIWQQDIHDNFETPEPTPAPTFGGETQGRSVVLVSGICRDTVIANAEAYRSYSWYASNENLYDRMCYTTGGGECPVGGSPWTVGWHTGVAYAWGGFDFIGGVNCNSECSLDRDYQRKLDNEKFVGDTATGCIPTANCTAGVDCSGFVSRTWEESRRTTYSLRNISDEIPSGSLQAGDILNCDYCGHPGVDGHVVLFSYWDDGNQPVFYEAVGEAPYKVRIHSGWTYVDQYVPRRYNNIEDCGPDTTSPTIDFYDYPERDRWYNSEQYVNYQVSDDRSPRGNIQFQQKWDYDTPYGGWMTNPDGRGYLQLSWAGEGWHKAYVNAKDEAGNEHEESLGWWGYDVTTPSNPTSIWSTSHSRWSWSRDNTIEVCWSGASDDGGSGVDGYSYEWSTSSTTTPDTNKGVEENTNCVTSSSLSDSNNWYFHIRTVDNAGNWNGSAAHYGPFYIDTTGPTIDFYSTPQTHHWYNTDQRVSWQISDGGSGRLGFSQKWGDDPNDGPDNTSPQFYTYAGFMDFSYIPEGERDGKHWACVRAWDQVGNQRMECSGEYWYDATAPTNPSVIINDNATYTNNRNVSLALSASDLTSGLSQMNLRNEGESWAGWRAYQSPYSWTLPSGDGTKTVYAQFKDAAGNTSPTASDSITLDTTAPNNPTNVDVTPPVANDTCQNSVNDVRFTWSGANDPGGSASGVADYCVYWGSDPNGTSGNCQANADYDPQAVPTGTYYLRVSTRDRAGNTAGWTILFTLRYDGTPPPAPSAPATETHGGASDVWQRTVNDPAFTWGGVTDVGCGLSGYRVYWGTDPNGAPSLSITSPAYDPPAPTPPDGETTHYLRVRAEDVAGNASAATTLFIFRYDGAPPTGSLLINNDASTTNQVMVQLSINGQDAGSGVKDMRLSDGRTWTGWDTFRQWGEWRLPTRNHITYTVSAQLKDLVGNESAVLSDDIYLELYPLRPASASYQLGARSTASGSGEPSSESYQLAGSTLGQALAGGRARSRWYRLESGFQGAWPSVPRGRPPAEEYDVWDSVVASSGDAPKSEHYRLYGTSGQPTSDGMRSSENYQLVSGFWLPADWDVCGDDYDRDGAIGMGDVEQQIAHWRTSMGNRDPDRNPDTPNYEGRFDRNLDGEINVVDILHVTARWGQTCSTAASSLTR
jgi:hypothetical protein